MSATPKKRIPGHVEQRGKDWFIRYSARANGQRTMWRDGPYPTQEDAVHAKLARAQLAQPGALASRTVIVAEWLTAWSAEFCRDLIETKHESYAKYIDRYVRLHLAPELGGVRMAELGSEHVSPIWAKMVKPKPAEGKTGDGKGLARKSMTNAKGVLAVALREAKRQKLLDNVDAITESKVPMAERGDAEAGTITPVPVNRVLNWEQIGTLADWCCANAGTSPWALPLLFIIETGARRGEGLALCWEDFGADARSIRIRQQVLRLPDGTLELRPPKTGKSRRTLTVTPRFLAALDSVRERRTEGLMFTDGKGGLLNPESFGQFFSDAVRTATDLPKWVTLHTMRHTHASLLLAMRIPVSTVSARLGHSSTTVTEQVYTHFVPAADEAAADAWAERSMAAKPKQPGK